MTISTEHLDELAAAFLTLGRLHLQAPSEETLDQLKEMYAEWPLEAVGETEAGLVAWQESFEIGESAETIKDDLNWLYGVAAKAKVPPYESVHRGEDHLIFDADTLDVRAEYKNLGLQAPRLNQEPDDHIGLEFDFVSHCLQRALTARENDAPNDADRYLLIAWQFYTQHLLQWAPEMLASAKEEAETRFLTGLEALSLGALDTFEKVFAPVMVPAGTTSDNTTGTTSDN